MDKDINKSQACRSNLIANTIGKRNSLARVVDKVKENITQISEKLSELETKSTEITRELKKLEEVETLPAIKELQNINFQSIHEAINQEKEALAQLEKRFSRKTINIAVIGYARQGKSLLLQKITGLSASEIPDGDGGDCTGVKSIIKHNPYADENNCGRVEFYTASSFVNEIIAPYYERLNLGKTPTFDDFAQQSLPELPQDIPGCSVPGSLYESLKKYHENFAQYSYHLQGNPIKTISRKEIREYVAQYNINGEACFNYLAVKQVEINWKFKNTDIGQIALIDLPGLGNTNLDDTSRMIEALGKDVDFVLFLRKPDAGGSNWRNEDTKLYDLVRDYLQDLPLKKLSYMIINQTSKESGKGDNFQDCKRFKDNIKQKKILVQDTEIADCFQEKEATAVLDSIIDYLSKNLQEIDLEYAQKTQYRLLEVHKNIESKIKSIKNIFPKDLSDSYREDEELFSRLFKKSDDEGDSGWWRDVTLELEKLKSELWLQRENVNEDLRQGVSEAFGICKQNKGIISAEDKLQQINNKIIEVTVFRAYPDYQDELRLLISHRFLNLDSQLKPTIENIKQKVVEVLKEQGRLKKISESKGTKFFQDINAIVPKRLEKLKSGIEIFIDFELSYRGLILPRIRRHLDRLTNIRIEGKNNIQNNYQSVTINLNKDTTTEQIITALEIDYDKAINDINATLQELLKEPNEAAYSMVEEFVDNIIRRRGIQEEWKNFLRGIKGDIWVEEFGKKEREREIKSEWNKLLEDIEKNNTVENFKFSQ